MATTKLSVSATPDGPGTIPFQIGANGKLAVSTPAPATAPTEAPPLPAATPETPETPAATPFQKMYPGVDPGKVEFFLDDKTNKLKYREIAQEAPAEPPAEETPVETPTTPEPTTTPSSSQEITQLRSMLDQQQQLMQAVLIAQAQGRPLAEVLGLQTPPTPEPDYSQVDMYDPAQAANLVRDVVRAEIQTSMQQHQPALEAARVRQEYDAVALEYQADPQFQPRMMVALQLAADAKQAGTALRIKTAYQMASKILPQQAATPTQASANQAKPTTLTPEQAAAKAEQAARLPQSGGVRGAGKAVPPEGLKKTRDLLIWGMHQDALGNLQ